MHAPFLPAVFVFYWIPVVEGMTIFHYHKRQP